MDDLIRLVLERNDDGTYRYRREEITLILGWAFLTLIQNVDVRTAPRAVQRFLAEFVRRHRLNEVKTAEDLEAAVAASWDTVRINPDLTRRIQRLVTRQLRGGIDLDHARALARTIGRQIHLPERQEKPTGGVSSGPLARFALRASQGD